MRRSPAIERRLAAAEHMTKALVERRVAELVADEFNSAPEAVQVAIHARVRAWHQRQASDPTLSHDITGFLRAVADAAPEIANRVAGKLGIGIGDSA
jgi:hypothetical protein